MKYGFSREVGLAYDSAVEKVTAELAKEGFGILTAIDVKETMKKKLGVEFTRYVILGACNPPLAHRALQAEEQIGLLLPCNVIVYEKENRTVVAAFDPMIMSQIIGSTEMGVIAEEVKARLCRAIEAV